MSPQEEGQILADEFMQRVSAKFEEFYQKSPFAKVDRVEFTREEVHTAMYGSYLAGHTEGLTLVEELDKILKQK